MQEAKERNEGEKLKLGLSPLMVGNGDIREHFGGGADAKADALSTKVWGLKQATAIWPIESP